MPLSPRPDGVPPPPRQSDALRGLALELARDPIFLAIVERERPAAHVDKAAEALVADLQARLRPACSHLTDAEFAALVLDVARMKLRFAAIDARWVNPAAGTPEHPATAATDAQPAGSASRRTGRRPPGQ